MPKGRFTSLDLRCAVRDIKANLLAFRVANIYDLNGRTYLFKLSQSGTEGDKMYIVVESGIRIHSTTFTREHREVPSVFALKLRKHIRTRKLEGIRQLGFDRVVDMTFGQGEVEHHVIIEFYAAGNIVLTDAKYKIITLLRPYTLEDGSAVAVNETYPINTYQAYPHYEAPQVLEMIKAAGPTDTLHATLAKKIVIGTEIVEHCILSAGVNPKQLCKDFDESQLPLLAAEFSNMEEFAKLDTPQKGFITCRSANAPSKSQQRKQAKKAGAAPAEAAAAATAEAPAPTDAPGLDLYDTFAAYPLKQFAGVKVLEFPDFNKAVDEFFSKIEGQKIEEARITHENSVTKKLDKAREDQSKRIEALESQEVNYERCAALITQNAALVDQAIRTINSYIAQQISWDALADLVKQAKKLGDPVASIIFRLRLDKNEITLLLYDTLATEEDDLVAEAQRVDVDLGLAAHANATQYYGMRKKVTEKKQKTVEASKMALKKAETKAVKQLKEVKVKAAIQKLRKPYWFEKFNWFISSDGHIVVSGRDMQQNEVLYKRYMQKGDIYVHADVHGASTCIIKNPGGGEVPPKTLSEAGTLSICQSKAWKNKIVTSAWWVYDHQVSKTAPSGEYLTTGSFMIRGKKNFLPPSALVMGFGILFRLADESIPAHLRSQEGEGEDGEEEEDNDSKAQEESTDSPAASTATPTATGEEPKPDEPTAVATEEPKAESTPATEASSEEKSQAPQSASTTPEEKEESDEDEEEDEEDDEDSSDEEIPGLGGSFQINLTRDEPTPSSTPAPATTSTAADSSANADAQKGGKKRISRKQRKMMKKSGDGIPIPDSGASQPQHKSTLPQPKQKAPQPHAPRGKRSKLKKIKTKYAHQDEEERQAAMELLKSSGNKQAPPPKEEVKDPKKKTDEERAEELKQKRLLQQKINATRLAKDQEEEEIRRLMREEMLEQLTDADKEKLKAMSAKGLGVNLSALTPTPKPEDVILFAIAVCAPYEAMQSYKFKAKVTPGSYKKIKAAQLAINAFSRYSETSEREKALLKAIPEGELGVMMANSKVSVPGLQALVSKTKQSKSSGNDEILLEDL